MSSLKARNIYPIRSCVKINFVIYRGIMVGHTHLILLWKCKVQCTDAIKTEQFKNQF